MMKKTSQFIVIVLLMLAAFSSSVGFAQQMPAIPVDDQVRIGKLDCGLTYFIRHNDYPEHRVNFYIAQRVGSLQEEESQRGLAHFLEHMAFNGSEHFNVKGKGIIDYTRSLGVEFGRNINAYTSIAETVYNIDDVPSTRQSAIDSCLLILKDWSNGLLLTDEEIDKERGVIHEEWRLGQSAQMRMLERQLETLYPNSKYGKRLPIGLMSVVDNFPYQELRDYYHKWYRPDNQALVIVGDVDVDHIEAQIKELFKDCVLDPNAAQVVDEPVPDNDQPIIVVDKDKEQQANIVEILFKHDATPKANKGTLDYMLNNYMKRMMSSMLSTRMTEKAQEPECPFIIAQAGDGNYLLSKNKDAFTIVVFPKEGQHEAAVETAVAEVMRAAQHGFTDTEYARAQDEYLNGLESMYKERNKIPNSSLASGYCSHFLDNEPIPSVEQRYQMMTQIVPLIPVEAVNGILPSLISADGKNMVIVNFNQDKEGVVIPEASALRAAVDAGINAKVEQYVDNVKEEPLISKMPKKGKIKSEKYNSHFDYKELELSNGARVIIKKTDFDEDDIEMEAIRRGGSSLCDEADWANQEKYHRVLNISGLGEFSRNQLDKALAGKMASVFMGMERDYDYMIGNSTVKDLETMFQLTYLYFTDIRKDEKNFAMFNNMAEAELKNRDLEPATVFIDSVMFTLGSHNWRNRPFTLESLKLIDYDRILEMAKERTSNAAEYTFFFVGNFDEAVIRPLIEQYIASLPGKKGTKPHWVTYDNKPDGVVINHFTRKMEEPKAFASIYWYNKVMPYSLENDIKAQLLGKILDKIYLQKIREDAGAAYTTSVSGWASTHGDANLTAINVECPFKPEFAETVLQILNDEPKVACNFIDAASLEDFKETLIKNHLTNIKENWFWMYVLRDYVDQGVDYYTGYENIVRAQTPETISAFARELLGAGNKVEVVMMPEE